MKAQDKNEKEFNIYEENDNLTCLDCIYECYHPLLGSYCSLKDVECKNIDDISECIIER